VSERSRAIAARLDPVAARGEPLGEPDKSGLGAAERPGFGRPAIEGDAVIGHHHLSHHSLSSRAFK
jgi:hypothetical protein